MLQEVGVGPIMPELLRKIMFSVLDIVQNMRTVAFSVFWFMSLLLKKPTI